jgi:hypothetical protein
MIEHTHSHTHTHMRACICVGMHTSRNSLHTSISELFNCKHTHTHTHTHIQVLKGSCDFDLLPRSLILNSASKCSSAGQVVPTLNLKRVSAWKQVSRAWKHWKQVYRERKKSKARHRDKSTQKPQQPRILRSSLHFF